jgi:hypothetical protein
VPIVHITIANVGMEICGSKEPNFNFEIETSTNEEFNLLDLINTPHENLPKSASRMAFNNQVYTTASKK